MVTCNEDSGFKSLEGTWRSYKLWKESMREARKMWEKHKLKYSVLEMKQYNVTLHVCDERNDWPEKAVEVREMEGLMLLSYSRK